MRTIAVLPVAALILSACQPAAKQVVLDANTAITMAKSAGTPEATLRGSCYSVIATMFGTVPRGLLSTYEQLSEAQDAAKGTCAPVVAGVSLMVLQAQAAVLGGALAAGPAFGLP